MIEQEWQECNDPIPMLTFLLARCTKRKIVLYTCAGIRSLWRLLYDERSRRFVEVEELFADGQASAEELVHPAYLAEGPTFGFDFQPEIARALITGEVPEIPTSPTSSLFTPEDIRKHFTGEGKDLDENCRGIKRLIDLGVYDENFQLAEPLKDQVYNLAVIVYYGFGPFERDGEMPHFNFRDLSKQVDWPKGWLVREIFGNPFRPVTIAPPILTWHDGTIHRIAQAIYDERQMPAGTFDPGRMNILADALLDAGCDNEDIIQHCRRDQPHVRGCWLLDLLLGKE